MRLGPALTASPYSLQKKAAWKIGLTRVRTLNPAPSIPVQRLTRASPASEIDEKADGSIIPEDDPSMVVMSPLPRYIALPSGIDFVSKSFGKAITEHPVLRR
jgi:hypothetical protein